MAFFNPAETPVEVGSEHPIIYDGFSTSQVVNARFQPSTVVLGFGSKKNHKAIFCNWAFYTP